MSVCTSFGDFFPHCMDTYWKKTAMFLNGNAALIITNLLYATQGYIVSCHKRRNIQQWQTKQRATLVSPVCRETSVMIFNMQSLISFYFMALPLRGVRFLRSRKAAPDCRASIRLSITPVSSPSAREQITQATVITRWQVASPLTDGEEKNK